MGALQPTAFGQCVGAGALEIKCSPIKGAVMGVTRGRAHTLTNWVTFLDAILHCALLIRATRKLLAQNLKKQQQKNIKIQIIIDLSSDICLITLTGVILFLFT